MNVRWLRFCDLHGYDPNGPTDTGRNARFMAWIHAAWSEWAALNDQPQYAGRSPEQHAAFDVWLAERAA